MVVGYSGIIQSHVISCVIAGIFMALICLVMIRKLFWLRRLIEFVKAGVFTILLNGWYLVPFLDYMRLGYVSQDPDTLGRFRANGTFLSQLLAIFPAGTGSSVSAAEGLGQTPEMSYALGGGILAALMLYLYYRMKNTVIQVKQDSENRRFLSGLWRIYGVYDDNLVPMGFHSATEWTDNHDHAEYSVPVAFPWNGFSVSGRRGFVSVYVAKAKRRDRGTEQRVRSDSCSVCPLRRILYGGLCAEGGSGILFR